MLSSILITATALAATSVNDVLTQSTSQETGAGRGNTDGWLRISMDTDTQKAYIVWPEEIKYKVEDSFRLTIVQWPTDKQRLRVIEVDGGPEKFQCPAKGLAIRPGELCHHEPGLLPLVIHTAFLTVLDVKKQSRKTYKIDFALDALQEVRDRRMLL